MEGLRSPPMSAAAMAASPYLSPHISMVHRQHQSPVAFTPLTHVDASKRRKVKKKTKRKKVKRVVHQKDFFNPKHPQKLTGRQWIIYFMYCWGFFALGIFTSAPGPILPSLMTQVNCSLAVISYIFSARAIGFVIGSVISGYIMDRWQKYLTSSENGTKFLLQRKQTIADYLWSLPRWNCWPLSAHNVFTISLIIAAITNVGVPYVSSVWSLAILVTINGICFGNVNTFGNVLLLTLFDIEISRDIDFDMIYAQDIIDEEQQDSSNSLDDLPGLPAAAEPGIQLTKNSDKGAKQELLANKAHETVVPTTASDYGSLNRNDPAEDTMRRMEKQDERVGPFMQFLQAVYALGGLLAPIMIQISFELGAGYTYAFWFFSLLYIPPALVLLFLPEPVRMSVVSERLRNIEKVNRSTASLASMGVADEEEVEDPIEVLREHNKAFWAKLLCIGFASFLLWYVGAQVGYGMYVTTYGIDYLNTTPAVGRYLASANWLGLFLGRFAAVPLSHKLNALNMVRMDLIGTAIGCWFLFFTLDWEYAIWVSSIMVGFCMASVWPSMFVWAETMIPVTGIFASIMVGGGSLGEFLIPALQGNIMAAYGSQYFNHVMFAMALLLLLNLLINQVIAKRLKAFL